MICENIRDILERIEKSKNKPVHKGEVKLIVVTKTVPIDKIKEAIDCGITDVGENRVQEAILKFKDESVTKSVKKHLIGHLQTNKVKKAIEIFDTIQSVDSIYLLEEISRQAEKINKIQECFIEIKVSEEETKYGLPPEDLKKILDKSKELKNVNVTGLMTIAPLFENTESVRPYFKKAYEYYSVFKADYSLKYLSMGMTNDFEIAIEEGANIVRVGTGIFGERKYE
ncbi:MAG: YggS family pyridoxal phosphate enzyme [Elusimicrobia bacterium RIFOXYC2_FULL_34_12]|nr:MAG: YggS family pyridoxal phosphate enzyme [Elusimicrobia bacterium RIFOXYC2_FULL_34_12]OGS37835.1 MAG: YggS family pyridoxal phosphate enzyme [Elusimicrobia bacterium RIFOXYD2_FULL_34_30]HAM37972.1 YggS family pyridoxal phosphate-dependent enzyme [Elusimicrobiota bacterium]